MCTARHWASSAWAASARPLARRAAAGFGMRVLYHSQRPKQQVEARHAARQCSLDELLQQADFVCLTVPLSASTEGLIGARELALMKPGGILVNISTRSRGG